MRLTSMGKGEREICGVHNRGTSIKTNMGQTDTVSYEASNCSRVKNMLICRTCSQRKVVTDSSNRRSFRWKQNNLTETAVHLLMFFAATSLMLTTRAMPTSGKQHFYTYLCQSSCFPILLGSHSNKMTGNIDCL